MFADTNIGTPMAQYGDLEPKFADLDTNLATTDPGVVIGTLTSPRDLPIILLVSSECQL